MHDEVSETENLRKNLAVERMIVEGCDILLDVNQVFVRQGELRVKKKSFHSITLFRIRREKKHSHTNTPHFFLLATYIYMYQLPYLSTVNTNKYVCIYKTNNAIKMC